MSGYRPAWDDDALIAAYNSDVTVAEIARRFKASRGAVDNRLNRLAEEGRVTLRPRYQQSHKEIVWDDEALLEDYMVKGLTAPAIAEKLGVTRNQVTGRLSVLRQQGRLPSKGGAAKRRLPDDETLIRDYVVSRMSTTALGRKYGVHTATAHRRLQKLAAEGRVTIRQAGRDVATWATVPRTVEELEPLAAALGVTATRLRALLVEHGLVTY